MPKLTYFVENGENTLSHYGRLGMKWGQHIFTDSDIYNPKAGSAKRIRKGLNKLEKQRVKYIKKTYNPAVRKAKMRNTNFDQKNLKEAQKTLAEGEKYTKDLVKKISASGNFDIESYSMKRYRATGADWAAGILLTPAVGVLTTLARPVESTGYIVERKR